MAWQTRGARRYYYRTIRRGRTTRPVYVGAGVKGEQAAAEDAARRAELAAAEAARDSQQSHAAATAALDSFCDLTDLLMRATLVSQGYHQHQRGQWRRRRHAADHSPAADGPGVPGRDPDGSGEGRPG